MALVRLMTGSVSHEMRMSYDNLASHMTSSAHLSSSMGYVYGTVDYPLESTFFVTSSFSTQVFGEIFVPRNTVYDATTFTSPQDVLLAGQFVPRRNYYVSSSFSDDTTQDISTFEAKAPSFTALSASISTLDTITLDTTSNVEPDEPPFPDPPPVGEYDMNRFRKTYTHVRVRPRIRKYSSSP